ncbi:Uu.00g007740.m01.CDS01 [Anthostomella pinea]|uniref:Uu.00g007740.m01.CDS01 n=1 Tax=Anthostomella pinea TaxID=933095 RepID=A0AAI8VXP5_9PEZI|nr:Uu.00g007740.m01.CDS01 [Anthostomella pinea]
MAATDESNMPFIRNLASSDRKTRTSALDTLRTFLSASTTSRQLSALDNQKLWKGLFYSLWMCDRPIPQQNLCGELAGLISILPDEAVVPWLGGFWAIMSREWTSIDVLRMEKFLLLVRRVVGASLAWAGGDGGNKKNGGSKKTTKGEAQNIGRAEAMMALLAAWPLEPTGDLSKVPSGVRLHVLDIWVDEAEKLRLLEQGADEGQKDLLDRIRQLVEAQSKSTCKPVRVRAKESLADGRLPWNAPGEAGDDDEDGAPKTKDASGDKSSWDGFAD